MTGAEIREFRERLGESQTDFAKHFDVSRPTLIRWEREDPPKYGPVAQHIDRIIAELQAAQTQ